MKEREKKPSLFQREKEENLSEIDKKNEQRGEIVEKQDITSKRKTVKLSAAPSRRLFGGKRETQAAAKNQGIWPWWKETGRPTLSISPLLESHKHSSRGC